MQTPLSKNRRGASDPAGFDAIVREVFAPIYPVIAEQIVRRTRTVTGRCLDAGCGTGALGRAVAGCTDLHVTFFDHSDTMLSYAKRYAEAEALGGRSAFVQGDIHNTGIEAGSLDLVFSRGSVPFWDDWERAYGEILRILRPGGKAYLGGGFGTAALREQIAQTMQKRNPEWSKRPRRQMEEKREALPEILRRLHPAAYEIIDDESGFWVLLQK